MCKVVWVISRLESIYQTDFALFNTTAIISTDRVSKKLKQIIPVIKQILPVIKQIIRVIKQIIPVIKHLFC